MDAVQEYPEINITYAAYSNEGEVVDIVKKLQKDHDVLLFAGSLPYDIAKENLTINKPMLYIKFEGTALYRVLFHLSQEGKYDFNAGTVNVSIDNMQQIEIEECFEELEITLNKLFLYEKRLEQDMDKLINYHIDLWQTKQIDVAITCVGSVFSQLQKRGVPAARIRPTRVAIRSSFQQAILEYKNTVQNESQIAVGLLSLNNMQEEEQLTEYQMQRRMIALQNILVDYGEESQSIIKWPEGNEVKFITTRGALQFDNNGSNEWKLLNEIFSKTEVKASLGIGIGRTANEAEIHAREALTKTLKTESSCFVVDMDGTVRGPIGNPMELTYSIRNVDEETLQMAKNANVGSATINRIVSFLEVYGKNAVTTVELANGLGITPRSARRILSKLEEVNLAKVTGEEQPINRGRPRQIYTLFLGE